MAKHSESIQRERKQVRFYFFKLNLNEYAEQTSRKCSQW